jgi:hypothetical protein
MIGRRSFLKVGLLGQYVSYPIIETVSSGGVRFGHSAFSEHLQSREFLTAMTLAAGTRAGDSRYFELYLEVDQYLQSPFLEPFDLDALGASGKEVFNGRALATVVLAGVSFKFLRPERKVEE